MQDLQPIVDWQEDVAEMLVSSTPLQQSASASNCMLLLLAQHASFPGLALTLITIALKLVALA